MVSLEHLYQRFSISLISFCGVLTQVIAFLYAAMRSVDIGLRTAIIVTPVNVLHNWRHEFLKWKPVELKALRVFMMDDVPRFVGSF